MPLQSYFAFRKGSRDTGPNTTIATSSCPELGIYALADGVAGERGAHEAAQLAATRCIDFLRSRVGNRQVDAAEAKLLIREAFFYASQSVYERGRQAPAFQGMNATLDVVWAIGRYLVSGHVGDGRIALLRSGSIRFLTQDHTYEAAFTRDGTWSPSKAGQSPFAHMLTRSVGLKSVVEVDVLVTELTSGDRILLLSHAPARLDERELLQEASGDPSTSPNVILGSAVEKYPARCSAVGTLVYDSATGEATQSKVSVQLKIDVLKRSPFFKGLTYTDLMKFLEIAEYRTLPANTVLMREGATPSELWVILTGKIQILKGKHVLAVREAGTSIGEMSVFSRGKRTASVVSYEPVSALAVKNQDLLGLMKRDSEFAARILWSFCETLTARLEDRTEAFAQEQADAPESPSNS